MDWVLFSGVLVFIIIASWVTFRGRWLMLAGYMAAVVTSLALLLILLSSGVDSKPANIHVDAQKLLVVLGDSYTSGEGADEYLAGTSNPGSNMCHRSSTAYPYLIAEGINASLDFIACSGARTFNVTGQGLNGLPVGDDGQLYTPQYPESPSDVYGGRFQIDDLRDSITKAQDAKLDVVVLLGIGGNDAQFAKIGEGCTVPLSITCQVNQDAWLYQLRFNVFERLVNTYTQVKAEADRVAAPVFVTTYPNALSENDASCASIAGMSTPEIAFLRDDFFETLNEYIRIAAARSGVRVLEFKDAFADPLCGAQASSTGDMNILKFQWTRWTTPTLSGLFQGTFHPTQYGHESLQGALQPVFVQTGNGDVGQDPKTPFRTTQEVIDRAFDPKESLPLVDPLGYANRVPDYLPADLRGPQPFPAESGCNGSEIAATFPTSTRMKGDGLIGSTGLPAGAQFCWFVTGSGWQSGFISADGRLTYPSFPASAKPGEQMRILYPTKAGIWLQNVITAFGDDIRPPEVPLRTAKPAAAAVFLLLVPVVSGVAGVVTRRRNRVSMASKALNVEQILPATLHIIGWRKTLFGTLKKVVPRNSQPLDAVLLAQRIGDHGWSYVGTLPVRHRKDRHELFGLLREAKPGKVDLASPVSRWTCRRVVWIEPIAVSLPLNKAAFSGRLDSVG